jgi:hypothetical protein
MKAESDAEGRIGSAWEDDERKVDKIDRLDQRWRQ